LQTKTQLKEILQSVNVQP